MPDDADEEESPLLLAPPRSLIDRIPRHALVYGGVCALLACQNSSYTLVRRFGHGVLKEEASSQSILAVRAHHRPRDVLADRSRCRARRGSRPWRAQTHLPTRGASAHGHVHVSICGLSPRRVPLVRARGLRADICGDGDGRGRGCGRSLARSHAHSLSRSHHPSCACARRWAR